LRLGFNLTTDIPPTTASGLIQPLLGIAVLALVPRFLALCAEVAVAAISSVA
jgi:hypothetical protein